jgi:hypothetical protein
MVFTGVATICEAMIDKKWKKSVPSANTTQCPGCSSKRLEYDLKGA